MGFHKQFVPKILDGTKIHSIRKGNRWKAGMKIHMATGVRTKDYHQFAEKKVVSVQNIEIENMVIAKSKDTGWTVSINDGFSEMKWRGVNLDLLFSNDGFGGLKEFEKFFIPDENKDSLFVGQIVHWTDFKY